MMHITNASQGLGRGPAQYRHEVYGYGDSPGEDQGWHPDVCGHVCFDVWGVGDPRADPASKPGTPAGGIPGDRGQVGRSLSSMNDDGQIHALVEGTVKMEDAGRIERAKRCAIIPVEGQVDHWGAAFCSWLRGDALPGAIGDEMRPVSLIDEGERLPFGDADRALDEGKATHANLRATLAGLIRD